MDNTLLEYAKLHLISLEQDIEGEQLDGNTEQVYFLEGCIETTKHFISVMEGRQD